MLISLQQCFRYKHVKNTSLPASFWKCEFMCNKVNITTWYYALHQTITKFKTQYSLHYALSITFKLHKNTRTLTTVRQTGYNSKKKLKLHERVRQTDQNSAHRKHKYKPCIHNSHFRILLGPSFATSTFTLFAPDPAEYNSTTLQLASHLALTLNICVKNIHLKRTTNQTKIITFYTPTPLFYKAYNAQTNCIHQIHHTHQNTQKCHTCTRRILLR